MQILQPIAQVVGFVVRTSGAVLDPHCRGYAPQIRKINVSLEAHFCHRAGGQLFCLDWFFSSGAAGGGVLSGERVVVSFRGNLLS